MQRLLSILFVSLSLSSLAQSVSSLDLRIEGKIADEYGNPIEGATIQFFDDNVLVDQIITDKSAQYVFIDQVNAKSTFSILVSKEEYTTQRIDLHPERVCSPEIGFYTRPIIDIYLFKPSKGGDYSFMKEPFRVYHFNCDHKTYKEDTDITVDMQKKMIKEKSKK